MATYYSTKAYVLRLTTSIYEELRRSKSNVHVSVLCPGPVKTNFNNVANVKFEIRSVSSDYVAKYAVDKMFKNLPEIPEEYKPILKLIGKSITPGNNELEENNRSRSSRLRVAEKIRIK